MLCNLQCYLLDVYYVFMFIPGDKFISKQMDKKKKKKLKKVEDKMLGWGVYLPPFHIFVELCC